MLVLFSSVGTETVSVCAPKELVGTLLNRTVDVVPATIESTVCVTVYGFAPVISSVTGTLIKVPCDVFEINEVTV